jgi:dTDP-4-dehydrorhamnose 3,5-epimerase
LDIRPTALPDVLLITPKRHGDARGWVAETFRRSVLAPFIGDTDFVQDNQSHSMAAGTLRGLHFQRPPAAQAKLVRVVAGSVFDVAVDLRRSSATFGQHVGVVLTAENDAQLFVPAGFAHGFVTLEPATTVVYKVSAEYDPATEGGLAWDDPDLAIDWAAHKAPVVIGERDRSWPTFADFASPFP